MMMFRIASHEFLYMFRSLQTLAVAGLFFGVSFLFVANGVEFQTTARGGNVFVNSPYMITMFLVLLSLLAVFAVPSYVATAVLKDVDHRFDGIMFSMPITKKDYVLGRFGGAFAALVAAVAAAPIGMYLGGFWPWAEPGTLGPNVLSHYVQVFFGTVVPSMFIMSAVIFALAIVWRNLMYSYMGALGILILYIATANSTALSAIWDPFLVKAVSELTEYWTAAERNSQLPGYSGVIFANRLVWMGVAIGFFTLAYKMFSFKSVARPVGGKKEVEEGATKPEAVVFQTEPDWSKGAHLRQFMERTKFEMGTVLSSMPFKLLMGFCLFMLFFALTGRETLYNVNTYPVTRLLLGAIQETLTMALMAVTAFYSADVIWRDRSHGIGEIIDALPAPNWVFVFSKVAALVLVIQAIVLLGVVIAVCLQAIGGYYDFQFGRYLGRGLLYYPLGYIYLTIMTCMFQVLARNRVVGILFFLAFIGLLVSSRDLIGVEHILLSYGLPDVSAPLSDMNENGRFVVAGYWTRLYWGSIAGLFLVFTQLFWNRGILQPLKFRLRNLRALKTRQFAIPTAALVTLFLSSGSYIFYNTNVLNTYRTSEDIELLQVNYEQKYRRYEDLPMPHLTDVKMEVDLYPYDQRVEARSQQILRNKTNQNIETIHLIFPVEAELPFVRLQGAKMVSADLETGYYIFNLETPMLPGQERKLSYETVIHKLGFPHARPDTRLVRNGTFIGNHQLAPYIGFYAGHMLDSRNKRRKHGLEALPRLPKLDDHEARRHNILRQDSDYINLEVIVSTVVGQTALAPGVLTGDWIEGDRHYFSYKMEKPIVNFYSFLSAEFEIARDRWNDVEIEVFYHGAHDYNVARMIQSAKDSLACYSEAFAPYQYKHLRIVEFPAYRAFAQAFPTTIPFSEGMGFIADVRDPNELDLPYFVTAHEVAHQWWGHQVMPANVQGSAMLNESLAQYSALLVMERRYGKHLLRRFLKGELDRYLSGRAGDPEGEMPLYKVEKQPYIHYRKGALVMYALRDYVGEGAVNRALRRLLENHAGDADAYPISTDLLGYLKEEAGVDQHALIEDLFQKITLYDLELKGTFVTELADGRFKVRLEIEAAKYYADALGEEEPAPFDISVDMGLFRKSPVEEAFGEDDVIFLGKRRLKSGLSSIEVIVSERPAFGGVDPYNKLLDRDSGDNLRAVESQDSGHVSDSVGSSGPQVNRM